MTTDQMSSTTKAGRPTEAKPKRTRTRRDPRRRLTPLEKAAAINRDELLADIVARGPAWTLHETKQAAIAAARENGTVSANELRGWLPEEAHINIGAAVRGLATSGVLVATGQYVPSDLDRTHGHKISVCRIATAADSEGSAA